MIYPFFFHAFFKDAFRYYNHSCYVYQTTYDFGSIMKARKRNQCRKRRGR